MTAAPVLPATLVLVGAGKMGGAMLEGWLATGLDPRGVTILDPFAGEGVAALCAENGMALNPAAPAAAPEALVLATKPQMLDEAAGPVDAIVAPGTVVISILAGKTIALVFEKASTRTRLSFEAAMTQLGGHCIVLPPTDSQMNRGEPLEDTARVTSR